MVSVEFIYEGNSIIIQSDLNDNLKDIINKYISKIFVDKNSLIFTFKNFIKFNLIILFEIYII